jgi:hypothetical protein
LIGIIIDVLNKKNSFQKINEKKHFITTHS